MPEPHEKPTPQYPNTSSGANVEGTVEVEAIVSATGSVVDARVTKSLDTVVDESCRGAALRWTFDPAVDRTSRGTKPVSALVLLRFEFAPPRGDKPGSVAATLTAVQDPPDVRAGQPPMDVVRPGAAGSHPPELLREVSPSYTGDAMRANIQGDVEMQVVILADGVVGAVRVVKSLDARFGLDEEAVRVTRHWLFYPGTVDGKPVPMIVTIVQSFRLH